MKFSAHEVCAQIRLDWQEGRYDAGPSKKCPGGYSIPADKQCGGDRDSMKQRYKATGAIYGGSIAGLPGSAIGSKVGSLVARRKLAKGAEPSSVDKTYTAEEWKDVKRGSRIGSLVGPVGAMLGAVAGNTAAARSKAEREERDPRNRIEKAASAGAARVGGAVKKLRGK